MSRLLDAPSVWAMRAAGKVLIMLRRFYSWFETRIDPFARPGVVRPPATLGAFYWHYVKPVWPAFAVLLVVGFLGSITEVMLFAFIG